MPHRDKLLLLSGIDNRVAAMGVTTSDGHNLNSRTFLTCMPIKPALDAQGNIVPGSNCVPTSPAGGPSIEYYLANQLKDRVLNWRLGTARRAQPQLPHGLRLTADWGDPNPQNAFKNLFKDFGGTGGPPTPEDRLRSKRKSVLDAVQTNFNRVLMRAGREDRQRLQRHVEHIREFETGSIRRSRSRATSPPSARSQRRTTLNSRTKMAFRTT